MEMKKSGEIGWYQTMEKHKDQNKKSGCLFHKHESLFDDLLIQTAANYA